MTNETKQTAVEWLVKEYHLPIDSSLVQQAKEMEKQNLMNAQMDMFHFLNNLEFGIQYLDKRDQAEEYCKQWYYETYGGNK